jgi:hypothetical protein
MMTEQQLDELEAMGFSSIVLSGDFLQLPPVAGPDAVPLSCDALVKRGYHIIERTGMNYRALDDATRAFYSELRQACASQNFAEINRVIRSSIRKVARYSPADFVFAATNAIVGEYNALYAKGTGAKWLKPGSEVDGKPQYEVLGASAGMRAMVRATDKRSPHKYVNGELVSLVERVDGDDDGFQLWKVAAPDGSELVLSTQQMSVGGAFTFEKSQGMTIDGSVLIDTKGVNASKMPRSYYVAFTRARSVSSMAFA